MAILDQSEDIWRTAPGFPRGAEPDALILEGTWWRQEATAHRLAHLDEVKELAFPEIFVGTWRGARGQVVTSPDWGERADTALKARAIKTRRAHHLTWPGLFAQTAEQCRQWARQGYTSVDMETSATVAVARFFGVNGISMLSVRDALAGGRTFLDPLEPQEAATLKHSNEVIFEVALSLAEEAMRPRKHEGKLLN